MNRDPHDKAGQVVTIVSGQFAGENYRVEDWWDRLTGKSWMISDGNPACLDYAIRAAHDRLPTDDDVVYGHLNNGLGKLIHISQLPGDDNG